MDFCFKYNHDPTIRESVLPFIQKLKAKRQSRHQLAQATKAIELYLEIDGHLEEHDKQPLLNTKTFDVSIKKTEVKEANADWRPVYNGLESEIKLRHYSPRTLEAYRTWARHLQGFTKSKDPSLLSSQDVKDFLTHLAVKRKVSASSQNQAFNALLFLYRHVIKKDFGEIKEIPRPKRKPGRKRKRRKARR